MNLQILNQLIVDRAANQMPADIAELLDAYLEHDALAARRLYGYRDTVNLATRALRDESSATIPPFPAARIEAARRRRVAAGLLRPVAIAAGLGLAFLTGMKWNRPKPPLDAPAVIAAIEPNNGFWIAENVRSAMSDRQSANSNRVRWSSPLRWPQHGGQS